MATSKRFSNAREAQAYWEQKITVQSCCNHARIFEVAALYLFGAVEKATDKSLKLPACVNHAFAIEVYLKCVLLLDGVELQSKANHIHDFKTLFNVKLKSESRKAIQRAYDKHPQKRLELGTVLEHNGKLFQWWRYLYDRDISKALNQHPLRRVYAAYPLIDAIKQRIVDLDSSLKPCLERT